MPQIFPLSLGVRELSLAVAAFSLMSVGSALALQYLGGVRPCHLCLMQRYVYYAAVPLALLAFFLSARTPLLARVLLGLLALGFVANSALGVYHSGVEWHFWAGPDECTGLSPLATSPQDLMKALSGPNTVVRCDEAPLRVFGVSLAGYSALLSAFIAVVAATGAAGLVVGAWPPSLRRTR